MNLLGNATDAGVGIVQAATAVRVGLKHAPTTVRIFEMITPLRPAEDGASGLASLRANLATALRDATYEILPFKATEQSVLRSVPCDVPLTVTVTATKGLDSTLALAERLTAHGYLVTPHIAARLVLDDTHLEEIIERLCAGSVRRLFIVGGDSPAPAGRFTDALGLLEALDAHRCALDEIGIGAYPEGHGSLPDDLMWSALAAKAPRVTYAITQLCFSAPTTVAWASEVVDRGIQLPIRVGLPGPVSRQKLIRISAGLGLGPSARFLLKQQSVFWRFLHPSGFNPHRLVRALAPAVGGVQTGIQGFHFFTFNELENTEQWRRKMLSRLTV